METRRYDGKLDSFLHRNLPRDEYERVCTSELCVVVYPDEKRVHKHAILGHRCLYLTEFPPKKLKLAVPLQDVTSIRMLDDLPDFLSGKEKEETTHVQIHYRKVLVKEKSLLTSLSEKSPKVLTTKGTATSEVQRAPSPLAQWSILHQTTLSSPNSRSSIIQTSFVRSHSSQSLSSLARERAEQRRRSLSPVTGVSLENLSMKGTSVQSFRSPLPNVALTRSISPKPSPKQHNHFHMNSVAQYSSPSVQQSSLKSSPTAPTSGLVHSVTISPLDVHTSLSPASSLNSISQAGLTASIGSINNVPSSPVTSGTTSSTPNSKSLPSHVHHRLKQLNSDMHSSTTSLESSGSLTSSTLSLPDTVEDGLRYEVAVMDLYILKQTTDFYNQLSTSWEDFKIVSTLNSGTPKPASNSQTHNHFFRHFCSLKNDLLSSSSLETSAKLAQELCTACQKYFVLKKLFWEDSELLELSIDQLRTHLPSNTKGRRQTRADQIEYSIILMDLIQQMIRETQNYQKRLVFFTRNGGQLLLVLATAIVQLLPLHKSSDTEGFDNELTEKACGVIFELLRITQQAKWPLVKRSSVCTSWMVDGLAALSNIKDFCARMVSYTTDILSRHPMTDPEPQSLLSLYQIVSIMNTLVQNSPVLATMFQTHFAEEFRYFISITGAKQRLPEAYPLRRDTIELLHNAKSRILRS